MGNNGNGTSKGNKREIGRILTEIKSLEIKAGTASCRDNVRKVPKSFVLGKNGTSRLPLCVFVYHFGLVRTPEDCEDKRCNHYREFQIPSDLEERSPPKRGRVLRIARRHIEGSNGDSYLPFCTDVFGVIRNDSPCKEKECENYLPLRLHIPLKRRSVGGC